VSFPWINIVILLGLVLVIFMAWRIWERFEDRVIDPSSTRRRALGQDEGLGRRSPVRVGKRAFSVWKCRHFRFSVEDGRPHSP
jgi:hypothetical protein